jgi:sugar phosphate isomerase/epimerase
MHRVLSTYLFVNRRLAPAVLADIAHAGIPAIELFCTRSHFDYRSALDVRELADWLAGHDLSLHSVHAPTDRDSSPGRESGVPISICDLERLRRLDAVDEVKHALDLAEQIPFRFLVQHVGAARESSDPRKWDAAFNSLEHLVLFAKQRGVTIALENTPGELATPTNLCNFILETRLHDLRLCFDTGHAHMEDGVETSFETMRERVVTTHVHDNHGEKDEHLLPYEGTIPWDRAVKALGRGTPAAQELPFVLELKEPVSLGAPLEASAANARRGARTVFDRFELTLSGISSGGKDARTAQG